MDPRPNALPIADDRELTLPDQVGQLFGPTGTIEVRVSQRDPHERGLGHGTLQEADRIERLQLLWQRIRIEWVILGLDQ